MQMKVTSDAVVRTIKLDLDGNPFTDPRGWSYMLHSAEVDVFPGGDLELVALHASRIVMGNPRPLQRCVGPFFKPIEMEVLRLIQEYLAIHPEAP